MQLRQIMPAVALVVLLTTLIASGANPQASGGGSAYDVTVRDGGRIHIVTTDADGNRRERVHSSPGDTRAFLGVRLERDRGQGDGARIERVLEDSPAAEAGLRDGDVVVRFNGQDVADASELSDLIDDLRPGDRADLNIRREGRELPLSVELGQRRSHAFSFQFEDLEGFDAEALGEQMRELGERLGSGFQFEFDGDGAFNSEEFQEQMRELGERLENLELDIPLPDFDGRHRFSFGPERPKLGVQLVPTTEELRRHLGGSDAAGVLVSKVLPGMPAEEAGVRVGDLIVAVDGQAIKDIGELIEALSDRSGETIELELVRDGRTLRLQVRLEEEDQPAGDRASNIDHHDAGRGMGVAARAYAAAMEAAHAASASRASGVDKARKQRRRAIAAAIDLSDTY